MAASETLILGLAGLASTLVSTGLGLYFTSRARAAPMRQHLYERQLALMLEIVELIGKLRLYVVMMLEPNGPFRERARDDFSEAIPELSEASESAAAIFPTELYVEVRQISEACVSFAISYDEGKIDSAFNDTLAGHAAKTALMARVFLGVDELSTETTRLFGTHKEVSKVERISPADLVRFARGKNKNKRAT